MNKKSQFFMVSVVIIGFALASMAGVLSQLDKISQRSFELQTSDLNDFQSSASALIQLTRQFYESWPKSHEYSSAISFLNFNGDSNKSTAIMKIKADESAILESFFLAKNDFNDDFSISHLKDDYYLIGFKDSFMQGEKKDYSLLYSKSADDLPYYRQADDKTEYYESAGMVNYCSNEYCASINKTSGKIESIKLEGIDFEAITSMQAKMNDLLQQDYLCDYSFIDYFNNVLSIGFSCQIGTIELVQNQSFHPSFFSISNDFNINFFGNYNLSLYSESALSSLAHENGIESPLSHPDLMLYDSKYASIFASDKGILMIGNDSKPFAKASPNIGIEIRINQTSFETGNYFQSIIIMPFFGQYNDSIKTANNYLYNPFSESISFREDFLKTAKASLSQTISNAFNKMEFYPNFYDSSKELYSISKKPSAQFSEFKLKGIIDLNKSLMPYSGKESSISFSSDNYWRNSSFPFQLCNNDAYGVANSSFEFMKFNGSEIIIGINSTGEINAKIYDYSNNLLHNENLNGNSIIQIESNLNGLHKLVISNNHCFKISINAPMISANSPIIVNSSGNAGLFFSANEDFNFQKTNIQGTPIGILKSHFRELKNSSQSYTESIQSISMEPINYEFTLSEGMALLMNNNSFSPSKESHLSKGYEIKAGFNDYFSGIKIHELIEGESEVYCPMQYSESLLNHGNYAIDFETGLLEISGEQWNSSNKLFKINGQDVAFNGMIMDSCLKKSFEFDSNYGKMVFSAINNSNAMILEFENLSQKIDLRINAAISQSPDSDYFFNDESGNISSQKNISSKSLIYGINYAGKNDSGKYFGIIFDLNDAINAYDSIIIQPNYIQISLPKYSKKIYLYFSDDFDDFKKAADSIANQPFITNRVISYEYSFLSDNFKSSGTLKG